MDANRAFYEFEEDDPQSFPEIQELNIISGGCR